MIRMRWKQNRKQNILLLLLLVCAVIVTVQRIQAVSAAQETYVTLIDTKVGRYRLNYTGNTNHYTLWTPDGLELGKAIYNDTNGPYANSSTALLSPSAGAERIRYAFLVWETRAPQAATEPIGFITSKGQRLILKATKVVNDYRIVGNNPGITSMFCMAVDVTSIVKDAGYGSYSVCNIPRWVYGQGGDRTGGESPGSWQLIVVEEGDSLPVRAVTLDMGAKFYLAKDFGTVLTLGSGLKSKSAGQAGGQVFFGASNASASAAMRESVTAYSSGGGMIGQVHSNTTFSPGLYQNGALINARDYGNGCIRMSLSDITNIGNEASRIHLTVQNNAWTTSFLLGMSVDIAYPDFRGEQRTIVNNPGNVTISGSFTNTAGTPSTGIYSGNMTVTIADGLTAVGAAAVVNNTTSINGRIEGNTVIFEGAALASMMNGSGITYTIECAVTGSGKTRFDNSAAFHGYLCADGVRTGYWIDRMWTSSSYGIPKYTVMIGSGTGIATVSGAGEYTYGSPVTVSATVKPGYHWKGWSGSYSSAQQEFRFPMPAGNLTLTAEGEANKYTIRFDPNDGMEEIHIEDIVTQYDKEEILPDGATCYCRYTLDGVDVTEAVAAGTIRAESGEASAEQQLQEEGNPAAAMSQPESEEETITLSEETADGQETAVELSEETADGQETAVELSEETADGQKTAVELSEETADGQKTAVELSEETADGQETAVALSEETAGEEDRQPKAYASVFMGWAKEDGRNGYIPQWKAGETVSNLTEEENGVVTLYAIWDDCPWIQVQELYYTLEQARSGFITEAELLSHATASDREDGSPIAPGFHENGTAFFIPDYAPEDFTQFEHGGSCTENLTVTDSIGNTYQKQLIVHVVDTEAEAVLPQGTTRFIDETYYGKAAEQGGLAENSVWKNDPAYRQTLAQAFEHIRNDTPVLTIRLSTDEIREMKTYVESQEPEHRRDPAVLRLLYERFLVPAIQ